ncbi:MAG: HEPN domain-containing protein [Candidatus Ranarchaeia archaeon]
MHKEWKEWFNECEKELQVAKDILQLGHWNYVVFHCQQAAEKAVKALLHFINLSPWGHSSYALMLEFYELSKQKPDDDVLTCCSKLDTFYTSARYPSIAGVTPYRLFNRGLANEAINCVEKVIRFVKNQTSK